MLNIYERATVRAKGNPSSFLPIYDVQNPGLFLLVAELYTRAGATTPLPLEITSIVLFNVGALCFFFWVYALFADLVVAAFATAFLLLSKFFLFFPGVTHTFPYEFAFFNITMLFFVLFLKNNKKAYLVASLVAMFITCMNYWFYYMSSWIIMVGLWWQYRGRPRVRDVAIISAPPIAAATFTAIMVMSLSGGVKQGVLRLADILVARTFDARIPGGAWHPEQRFMNTLDWLVYPTTVATRLEWSYSLNVFWFAIATVCTFFLLSLHNRRALVSALILLAGGFSWYCVMFQHTHIHAFVGQYSFMAICPIFGLIISEAVFFTRRSLHRVTTSRATSVGADLATAALLMAVVWAMIWPYLENTYGLIMQTVEISRTAQAKYATAIQSICRQHPDITLADLESASKDWGFEWIPRLITETNQTPRCSSQAS
ncbi:hypothetical protein [Bradyrhizobium canariense]|uniref:hypothetical protein n=1 Tax=Bradyrhizobium canariense TaxID=255045 RepID=UPI0011BA5067|nr:hypothetical protein [Bradyrhizobium canariense]